MGGNQGRTDDSDPITGLTNRDVHLVQSTWVPLQKNATKSGITIFINLFTKHPQYQDLFPFKNIPLDVLPENKRFQAHCNNLMYGFSAIIDHLPDAELLVELLKKQGVSHKPRGVTENAYWELKDVLIDTFSGIMAVDAVKAWDKTLNVAFKTIIEGAKSG